MNKKIIVAIIITAVVIIAGIIGIILLNNSNNTNTNSTDKIEGLTLNNSETTNNVTTSSNNNVLVAYFSYSGNTEKMAQNIHNIVGGDIFEIKAKENYSNSNIREVSKDEIDNKKSRELKDKPQSLDQYDVIYIGFPIWYSTTPRVVNTFLESYDLSDKTIIPFCTSSSSEIDSAIPAIKESAPNSKILDGIRMSGSTANSSEGKAELQNWISELGL